MGWKFAKFSPTIFWKNSVKLTFSLKSYTADQFDEKFLQWGKISEITTLWWNQTLTFKNISLLSRNFCRNNFFEKFREINFQYYTRSHCESFSRNFFPSVFPHCFARLWLQFLKVFQWKWLCYALLKIFAKFDYCNSLNWIEMERETYCRQHYIIMAHQQSTNN